MDLSLPRYVEFAHPWYFLLLLLLPVFVLLGRRAFSAMCPMRRWSVIVLRVMVVLLVIVALADPVWVRRTDEQTVVFALDQSDSIDGQLQSDAIDFMKAASKEMRSGKDLVASVGFAGRPSVWQLPSQELNADRLPEVADSHQTDIASALRLCLGMFPAQSSRRLVLVSDGNENKDVSAEMAQSYAALGIPIDVLPLRHSYPAEIMVDRLSAPVTANPDEIVELQLFVQSQRGASARLSLYHNGQPMATEGEAGGDVGVRLRAGMNRFTIPVKLSASGVHSFEAALRPGDKSGDKYAVNNQGKAFTIVGSAERVILVAGAFAEEHEREEVDLLVRALQEGGIEVEELAIEDLPNDATGLADCSTIILSNVSALALGEKVQWMLASFVHEQGGGLIVIGGDRSFSVGGYGQSPLEQVLPVETDRDRLALLSLGMVIVIDRSGSMNGEKLMMAKRAAIGAVNLLSVEDQIGVIAFNAIPDWVVPMRAADNRSAIARNVSTITCGGGTNLYPALEEAYQALLVLGTNLRHVIVLTDGQSIPGEFAKLADECGRSGITISTIAVGADADRLLLEKIAHLSHGRSYVAQSARPLPQIFVHETVLASRSGLFEKTFKPLLSPSVGERIMVGFSAEDIPPLGGYVITAAKPSAVTPLVRLTEDGSDPVLAYWQAGLGRTVAFTSGLWLRWGVQWASWSGFGKLWTQAVRYAGRTGNPSELFVETSIKDGRVRVTVSAAHLSKESQLSLELAGQVIRPDYSTSSLLLERTSLGTFEATFPADMRGTYMVNLAYAHERGDERVSGSVRSGVAVSYSAEYASTSEDESTLVELARRTGGRILDFARPEAVFEPWSIRPLLVRRPCWDLIIQLILPLFLLDVAIRRLAISPSDVLQMFHRFFDGRSGLKLGTSSVVTLAGLRATQERTRESEDEKADTATRGGTREAKWSIPSSLEQSLNQTVGEQKTVESNETSASTPPEVEGGDDAGHTSRLLRAKRRMRGD